MEYQSSRDSCGTCPEGLLQGGKTFGSLPASACVYFVLVYAYWDLDPVFLYCILGFRSPFFFLWLLCKSLAYLSVSRCLLR